MAGAQSVADGAVAPMRDASRAAAGWPPPTTATWSHVFKPPWFPGSTTCSNPGGSAKLRPASAQTTRAPGQASRWPATPSTDDSHAPAVGTVHVTGGVGPVEVADHEVPSVIDARQQPDHHLVVGGIAVGVTGHVVTELSVRRPVLGGAVSGHDADEVLVAEHGQRRRAR